ncbi:hypothetical protein WME97_18115 [Sorangium sp. So ce367]|uniref:hypothetical protein n=1 Tax=Sorangium sp. So ce367 TaxID=3133305 RepID=UPI003F61822F
MIDGPFAGSRPAPPSWPPWPASPRAEGLSAGDLVAYRVALELASGVDAQPAR